MDDGVLTLEKLSACAERLRKGVDIPIRPGVHLFRSPSFLPRMPVVLSEALVVHAPRNLTRWDRFRCWLEDLADEAELYWRLPRVQRSETRPSPDALLVGETLFMHPATYARVKALTGESR